MKYTEITLKSENNASLINEILFETASARASGTEVVRFNLYSEDGAALEKFSLHIKKNLRKIKQRGIIQFFATASSFSGNSTEAKFLQNKYPELFRELPSEEESLFFFYLKL